MRPGRVAAALAAIALALVACGGGEAGGSGSACRATGTTLNLIARNTRFDTDCLAMVAKTKFRIIFENHDPGVPHSIAIYAGDPTVNAAATRYFDGGRVQGPGITTYDVPALPAGTLFFRCEVHPQQMFGTFIVEG